MKGFYGSGDNSQFIIHHLELNYFCEFGIPLSTVDYTYYRL